MLTYKERTRESILNKLKTEILISVFHRIDIYELL